MWGSIIDRNAVLCPFSGQLALVREVVRAVQHDGGQLRSFQILGRKRARHLFSESRFHALSVIDGNLIGELVETFRGCFPKRAAGVDLADWSGCERKRDTAERRDVALARRAVHALALARIAVQRTSVLLSR